MLFYIQNAMLGVGLAMDACAVSMTNGLSDSKMKAPKCAFIAFLFAFFQGLMPLIGYFAGHAFICYIEKFIPWFALVLLLYLGIKMLVDGIKNKEVQQEKSLTLKNLLMQALATSIDALSVGLTFSAYSVVEALTAVLIISTITFILCLIAIYVGKIFKNKLGKVSVIFGGIILILIGIEIFVVDMFF